MARAAPWQRPARDLSRTMGAAGAMILVLGLALGVIAATGGWGVQQAVGSGNRAAGLRPGLERLPPGDRRTLGSAARRTRVRCPDTMGPCPRTPLPCRTPSVHFLAQPHVATVGTVDDDGAPRQAVVWYRLEDDDRILLNSNAPRRWCQNLVRDPRVALSVIDAADPYRWLGLTGDVEEVVTDVDALAGGHRRARAPLPPRGPQRLLDRHVPHPAARVVPRPRHRRPRPPRGLTWATSRSASCSGPRPTPGPALRDAAIRAEQAGAASLWTWDHLNSIVGPWEGPILEGWSILSGWSQVTLEARRWGSWSRPTRSATRASRRSSRRRSTTCPDGRAVLGIGGAWFEREHEAFGFDFGSGLRRAPRPPRRVRDAAPPPARRRADRRARGCRLPDEGRARGAAAGPGAPADHDRRLGAEEDAPHAGPVRRPVERDGAPGEARRRATRSCASTARRSAATRPRSSARRRSTSSSARPRDRPRGVQGAARRRPTQEYDETWNHFVGTPAEIAEGLQPIIELGFRHIFVESPAPYDLETIDRIGEVLEQLNG